MEENIFVDDETMMRLNRTKPKKRSLVITGFKVLFGIGTLFVIGTVVRNNIGQSADMKDSSSLEQSATQAYTIAQDNEWEAYKSRFQKQYATREEEAVRRENYHERMRRLNALNRKNGDQAVFGATRHTDRNLNENAYARGHSRSSVKMKEEIDLDDWRATRLNAANLRETANIATGVVDWRAVPGALSPVKNQGQCGSCWAFSTAEQIESQLMFATGDPMVEMSPQQITSCVSDCDGCGGGDTTEAYEYLMHTVGLSPEAYWPYMEGLVPDDACLDSACTASCDKSLTELRQDFTYIGYYAVIDDWAYATSPCQEMNNCDNQNLESLQDALKEMPVSVCLNAQNWDDYVGGVLSAEACGGNGMEDMDHCVSAVGYNVSDSGQGYFIVRNSWSTDWGQDGYIYLDIQNNACGIANEATVALVSPGRPAARSNKKAPTAANLVNTEKALV